VGTNNILSGTVTAVAAGRLTVATSMGEFAVNATNGVPAVGEAATFVIAADRITTAAEGDLLENRLHGRLRGEEFVGAIATLFLELDDGTEFRIQKQEHQLTRMSATLGDRVDASWDTTAAYLLPTP
jgi:spermidine/putrescine transport system ATP-binding protein